MTYNSPQLLLLPQEVSQRRGRGAWATMWGEVVQVFASRASHRSTWPSLELLMWQQWWRPQPDLLRGRVGGGGCGGDGG